MENTRKKPLLTQYSLALLSGQLLKCCFDTAGTFHLVHQTHRKPISLERLLFQIQARILLCRDILPTQTHQDTIASMDSLRQYFDKTPDKTLKLSLSMMQDQNASDSCRV